MAGCSKDKATETIGAESARFTTTISNTRAHDTSWDDGDIVGIMVTQENTLVSRYRYNNQYNVDATNSTITNATDADLIYYPADGSVVHFYAYYPYNSQLSEVDQSYPIDISDQSEPKDIDFMEASTRNTEGYTIISSSVELTFSHRMAKLSMTLVAGDAVDLSDITAVKLVGFYDSATYNFVLNEFEGSSIKEISLTPYKDATSGIYSAILIPENAASHMVYFTTPNGDVPLDLTNYTLESGKHHSLTVTVSQTEATYDENEINNWETEYEGEL